MYFMTITCLLICRVLPQSSISHFILPYITDNAALKWRHNVGGCLVQSMIGSANLDGDLPVAGHRQVASSTEVALAIRNEADYLGSHVHVQHSCRESDADVGIYFASAAVGDGDGEYIRAEAIRVDFKLDGELVIGCMYGRDRWRCFSASLLRRICGSGGDRACEDVRQPGGHQDRDAQHRFPA